MGQFPHPEIIDNQQGHGRDVGEIGFARAGEGGVGEFLEQRVRLTIPDAVALLNRGVADRLGPVTLPVTGGPRERTSSCCAMRRPMASSKTSARLSFLLKGKSKLSNERPGSRKRTCLRRRSRRRSRQRWKI